MSSMLLMFAALTGLFALFLALKSFAKKDFCVLCASVVGTWVCFLVLYRLGLFSDPVLIALFMGQSILGVYFMAEKTVPRRLLAFRFPFLLSITFVAYLLIAGMRESLYPLLLFGGLWLAFGALFAFRANKKAGEVFRRLLVCCKNW
ncbi:MAG: hypothetical protein Q8P39_01765 [Candidatus Yanofskybacteria bacterium]|nr:hypothetical protein [Candidatus Yanofskybacteria bacterium]